jgi:mRNA-degrading endonuclease toxin of MazEF toxin-antitoxin module
VNSESNGVSGAVILVGFIASIDKKVIGSRFRHFEAPAADAAEARLETSFPW